MAENRVRHSEAQAASLITDADEIARRESENALRQAEHIREVILSYIGPERPFRLRPSMFLTLNRIAVEGLNIYAGNWRPAGVSIQGSKHTPPDGFRVPELVEEICDYVNLVWESSTPVHLAALTMWRINWIHPFVDGNGRTARAVAHIVLSIRAQTYFPGEYTIPEQIILNREPYYLALEAADKAYEASGFMGSVVIDLETLISGMLAVQLKSAFDNATGQ